MQTTPEREAGVASSSPARFWLGDVPIDPLTRDQAVAAIAARVEGKLGGTVFTPNVDHVVLADSDARFRAAYLATSLSLVDGAPVLVAARLLGHRVPGRVTGSDLVRPLAARAAAGRWRVYLVGGRPGVAEQAAKQLVAEYPGLVVAGVDAGAVDMDEPRAARSEVVARARAARADLVLVALGSPKGELWAAEASSDVAPALLVAIGAGLDFLVGAQKRAPRWMSAAGLEWLFRLVNEPRRLWRRYLVRGPRFLPIVARAWREGGRQTALGRSPGRR